MIYTLMKRIIQKAIDKGELEEKKEGILEKLDAFYAADRLTTEEYKELVAMVNQVNAE